MPDMSSLYHYPFLTNFTCQIHLFIWTWLWTLRHLSYTTFREFPVYFPCMQCQFHIYPPSSLSELSICPLQRLPCWQSCLDWHPSQRAHQRHNLLKNLDMEEKLLIYLAIITDSSSYSRILLASGPGMQQQVQISVSLLTNVDLIQAEICSYKYHCSFSYWSKLWLW